MIINKNSNQSQLLKHVVYIMNDGSTDLKKFNNKTLFTVRLNIRIINDVTPAMKTFRSERQYSIRYRVLDRATNWKPNNTGRVTAVTRQ